MAEKAKSKQAEFRQFERMYAQVRKANTAERKDAVGLLTPKKLQDAIADGRGIVLAYGKNGRTVSYTLDELKKFAENLNRAKAKNRKSEKGVPLHQLESASDPKDKERAKQVRSAILYKFSGNILSFQVSASGNNGRKHYQVKIRLEDWYDHLTAVRSYAVAAKAVAVGRISFDCGCGRHQYWYRYLATIGNFALAPLEKDFPKIRNPQLKGCCCKHVLKVLSMLKSGTVQALIAKELERQAGGVGYVDKKQARFLTPTELDKAKSARGSAKDTKEAAMAFRNYKQAQKSYGKKLSAEDSRERLKALERDLALANNRAKIEKKRADEAEKKASKASMDMLANSLSSHINALKMVKVPREEAIKLFAESNKMQIAEVKAIAERYRI